MQIPKLRKRSKDKLGSELSIGVSTLMYPHDPVRAIEELVEADLKPERVEIALGKPLENPEVIKEELLELKNEYGLTYSVHVPFLYDDLAHPQDSLREAYVDLARDTVEMAIELGAGHVVVHPGGRFFDSNNPPVEALEPLKIPREEYVRNSLKSLAALSERAQSGSVRLLVENLAGGLCDSPEEVERLVSSQPNTEFLLDTGHGNVSGTLYELLELEPSYFHFHDNSGEEDSHLGLGRGNVDFGRLLERVKSYGGEKTVILELYSLEDVIGSLEFLDEALSEI